MLLSPKDIRWSIGPWNDDIDGIDEKNDVGYSDFEGQDHLVRIGNIPDGEYPLVTVSRTYTQQKGGDLDYVSTNPDGYTSRTNIEVKNGFINKQSVKAAVADVLIQSGGRQRFELDVAKYLNVLDESPVEAITEVVFVEGIALREDGKTLRVNLGT
tara:strand:- start:210 stop:677 length:468 start_codon:yes stop_codon:yes gene_type:complete